MNHKFVECTIAGQTFRFNLNLGLVRQIHKKFNFDLINMFTDQTEDEKKVNANTLLVNEELALDLAWFLIGDQYDSKSDELDRRQDFENNIQSLEEVDSFREAFWASVVNFTPELKKDHLLTLWKHLKKEIKGLDLLDPNLNSSSSDSPAEESIQTNTPSE